MRQALGAVKVMPVDKAVRRMVAEKVDRVKVDRKMIGFEKSSQTPTRVAAVPASTLESIKFDISSLDGRS
jgi:hypothetical protein